VNTRLLTASIWPRWLTPRCCVSLMIVAAGVSLCVVRAWGLVHAGDPRIAGALAGGLMASVATALGTLPVLVSQRVSQRASDAMLGFGAGIMLAATAFSLIVPSLQAARDQGFDRWGAGAVVSAGIALGAMLLLSADRWLPQSALAMEDARSNALRRAWVFVGAITLHNFPEGLAIGVAFAGPNAEHAQALTTGIAIQDVPEGLVVALALRGVGYGRLLSVGLGIVSGLIEPVAAILGAVAIAVASNLLPWGLAFAAGAMLYAVVHEAIPGSQLQGNARQSTCALVFGFVLMMLLDTALGRS